MTSCQPRFQVILDPVLQGVQQSGQGRVAFAPKRPDHVGDKDAAGIEPHVAFMLPRLGNELAGYPVGVGGVSDLGEGRPIGAAGIERIEDHVTARSEEHTSELQSLMRISYAVFCLTKKRVWPRTHIPRTRMMHRA